MRTAITTMAGLSALLFLGIPAQAQDAERYRLERTEDGYVRMDTRTGAMTLCRESSGELVCQSANESQNGDAASQPLEDRISELEARIAALEERLDGDVPLQEEFEQSLTLMERFFRRFVDIVRGLEEEQQEPGPTSSPPAGRT